MKKSLFVTGVLAFVFVFGMTVIGCSDKPQGNDDEWWEKSSGGAGTFSAGGGLDHYQRKKEEVYTEGRLTITGLNDYNGKNITAVYFKFQTITHSGIDKLVAGEKAFNSNIYKNNVLNSKMGSYIEPAIIAGGQVTLNLFEDKGEIQHYYGAYSGNHEKVYFYIYINEPETNKPFDNGYIYAVNFTNGIGSGAFVKTNPHYAPEEVEVTTNGRLTITGLDDYNGKKIYACGGGLWAYETAYNKYWYTLNGKVERIYPSKTILGTISDGQVTLKVFGRGRTYVDATGLYSESYYNFSGSALVFFWIQIKDDENEYIIVEKEGPYVQFNNGIGSMVFELEE